MVRNYLSYGRQYTSEQLRRTVEECVKAEEDVKTGRVGDVMSVELLLVKFSGN